MEKGKRKKIKITCGSDNKDKSHQNLQGKNET
jgi:hypothetical protein